MRVPFLLTGTLSLLLSALLAAQPRTLQVDATGGPGRYLTIDDAMLASLPGDRILVHPGTYPAFQMSVGVEVIGLGNSADDVVVQRIAFHPSHPATDWKALIANLTVRSPRPLDVLSIHGNELAPGTLTVKGCVLENGVYLRGGQTGFYLLMDDCKIEPPAGHGFTGEAAWLGGPGNWIDLRGTRVAGWAGDPALGIPAGQGLRVAAGTRMRIDACQIAGGAGGAQQPGGDAITHTGGGSSDLSVSGGSWIRGGDGSAGGHGIAWVGSLAVDGALVEGGQGDPMGLPYPLALPTGTSGGIRLGMTPELRFAEQGFALRPGDPVVLDTGETGPAVLGFAFATRLPDGSAFLPLPRDGLLVHPAPRAVFTVPAIPGLTGVGPTLFAQAGHLDPLSGELVLSNVVAATIRW